MITMRDIAVRAGVSRVTVSYVLNEKHATMGISENTRHRVLRASEELGYRRNRLAHAVVTGKNPVFVFLVPPGGVESDVTARILNGALEAAERHHHTVHVIRQPTPEDPEVIERCVELRPMGVLAIYTAQPMLDRLHEEMARYRIPVAVLDCSYPQTLGSRILSDDGDGARQAVAHLVALGHRRIAFIGGYSHMGVSVARGEGFRAAMREHGLSVPPDYLTYSDWELPVVEAITRRLFAPGSTAPTALFCADDKNAMVACRTLHRLGIPVPDAVSVVGFADLTMATFCDPPLTTVAQPFAEMGYAAVTRLMTAAQEIEDDMLAVERVYEQQLPTRLIVRESTGPAPTAGTIDEV